MTEKPDPLADGVHIGLPIARYTRDRALSGSAFKKILSEPPAWWWESEDNPLWLPPEKSKQRAQLRGSAAHLLVVEGEAAYAAAYMVKPQGLLSTFDELKQWMRARKAADEQRLGVTFKRGAESAPYLLGDDKGELIARIRALDPEAQIWDADAETREILNADDDAYVRVVERFLRNDPAVGPLLTAGLPELTFVWTRGGVRYKCRPDYLTGHTLLDLKTYGKPPKRGRSLRTHCVREAEFNGADLQAVHNYEGVMMAAELFGRGKLDVHCYGEAATEAAKRLPELLDAIATHAGDEQPWAGGGGGKRLMFRWLFVRMGGGPSSIVLPFRTSDAQWDIAKNDVALAVECFEQYRATCGDGIWQAAMGEVEIEDTDWSNSMRESY